MDEIHGNPSVPKRDRIERTRHKPNSLTAHSADTRWAYICMWSGGAARSALRRLCIIVFSEFTPPATSSQSLDPLTVNHPKGRRTGRPLYTRRITFITLQLAVDHAFTGIYVIRFRPGAGDPKDIGIRTLFFHWSRIQNWDLHPMNAPIGWSPVHGTCL